MLEGQAQLVHRLGEALATLRLDPQAVLDHGEHIAVSSVNSRIALACEQRLDLGFAHALGDHHGKGDRDARAALVTAQQRAAEPERAFPGATDVDELAAEIAADLAARP